MAVRPVGSVMPESSALMLALDLGCCVIINWQELQGQDFLSLTRNDAMHLLKLSLVVFSCLLASGAYSFAQENWGRYSGDIIAKFLPDGRNMRIERGFSYTDGRGRTWHVPAGATTDGASFTQFFWIAFPPFTGRYRAAAVVHDHYCQTKVRPWRETHEAFYEAMRASGVAENTAKAMYGAVYNFGPRWGIGAARRGPGADKYRTDAEQEAFFSELEAWIAREKPSAEEITKRLDETAEVPRTRR